MPAAPSTGHLESINLTNNSLISNIMKKLEKNVECFKEPIQLVTAVDAVPDHFYNYIAQNDSQPAQISE